MKLLIDASYPVPLLGRGAGQRPAVDLKAERLHPFPVLYCGSHRCRRHAWLAVLTVMKQRRAGSPGSDAGLGVIRFDDVVASRWGGNFH